MQQDHLARNFLFNLSTICPVNSSPVSDMPDCSHSPLISLKGGARQNRLLLWASEIFSMLWCCSRSYTAAGTLQRNRQSRCTAYYGI